ncbi:MAG: hypothetical protein RL015_2246, partial [Verrucomicrobiota bacterium]
MSEPPSVIECPCPSMGLGCSHTLFPLWGQRHLRRHFDAHALVVVEHLGGGGLAGLQTDAHHVTHGSYWSFLNDGRMKHGENLFGTVR